MKIIYLLKGFIKGKIRAIYIPLLSNSSIARRYLIKYNILGSNSLYCYNVWMKNLKYWSKLNHEVPKVVVEIGSGNSLGVGLAALISGSEAFFALEKTQFWNIETNIRVFDELVTFFNTEKKTKTISLNESTDLKEEKFDFPSNILTKAHLAKCLKEERLQAIRKELSNPESLNYKYIHSIIPWNNAEIIEENTVDYIISHTVLQRLDDLPFAYETMSKWLKRSGSLSHKIDFKSMNRTKLWNEHWTLNKSEWNIITGGEGLINREPLSTHLRLLEKHNFKIIYQIANSDTNTLRVEELSNEFKHLDNKDLTTSGFYYFAQFK